MCRKYATISELRGVRNVLLCRMGPAWIVMSCATWSRAIQRSRLLQSTKLLSIVNALAPGERRSSDHVGIAAPPLMASAPLLFEGQAAEPP